MTKSEARNIYIEASAICRDERETRKLCEEKAVPDEWIAEFMQSEEKGELLTE